MRKPDRVDLYVNLRTGGFSVKSVQTNLVLESNVREIWLENVSFVVRPSGQKRARDEKQRNVHAFVRGVPVTPENLDGIKVRRAIYNPFKFDHFVDSETLEPLNGDSYKVRAVIRDGKPVVEYY